MSTECAMCFCDVQLLRHVVPADASCDLASSGAIGVASPIRQLSDETAVTSMASPTPPLPPHPYPCSSSYPPPLPTAPPPPPPPPPPFHNAPPSIVTERSPLLQSSSYGEAISTLGFGSRVSEITLGQAKKNSESAQIFEAKDQMIRCVCCSVLGHIMPAAPQQLQSVPISLPCQLRMQLSMHSSIPAVELPASTT